MGFWPSTKLNLTVKQSADVTEASVTTPVDVPGLSVYLPRAGTYHVFASLPATAADATSRTIGFGGAYSGTATFLNAGPSILSRQTAAGTLLSLANQTWTTAGMLWEGVIVVSTPGTLKMQFSRSAASITIKNGVFTVIEGA